jgi:drug/metabolite transporter (DMT)-like permease
VERRPDSPHNTPMKLDAKAWAMLIVLSCLWGGSFLFAKIAVDTIPTFTLVALRVALAAAGLMAWLWFNGLGIPRRIWPACLVMGFINNIIPFWLIFWGQRELGVGAASIFNATTPLWTILLAHFLTDDEKLTGLRLAGVLTGIAGVAVLIGPDALDGLGKDGLAQFGFLAATFSYAMALIWARRFRGLPPAVPATGQLIGSSLIAIPLALIVDAPWTLPVPSLTVMGSVVALALASTALAYLIYFALMARSGAGNAALVTMLIPPSAMLMGWAVLGETPAILSLGGFAIILLGLALVDGRWFKR